MKRAALLFALTLLGCAPAAKSDAVLHLRIRVPYEEGDRPLARVQVRRDDDANPFDPEPWSSPEPFEVDLREQTDHVIELAVRTDDPDAVESQHLRIRIAFCDPKGDLPCDRDSDTPELAYFIMRPFYAGELTEWSAGPKGDDGDFHMPDSEVPSRQADFPRLGAVPGVIKPCSIAGCLEVADEPGATFTPAPETGYCFEQEGSEPVHFCAEDS